MTNSFVTTTATTKNASLTGETALLETALLDVHSGADTSEMAIATKIAMFPLATLTEATVPTTDPEGDCP